MILVWHDSPLMEEQWLREMLHGLVEFEISDPDLKCFEDNTIHVVSSNARALHLYEDYFTKCRSCCKKLILFHASDEFFSGGYRLYRHFDFVIRNFYSYLVDGNGILNIPEGYPNLTKVNDFYKLTTNRRYKWSFVGEIKSSRINMVKSFSSIEPKLLLKTESISNPDKKWLTKESYDDILSESMFSPCPMGNVILETWRFYESLERGCIPIVEKRWTLDYFTKILGKNPVPTFHNWKLARIYIEHAMEDPILLEQKQIEIQHWWKQKKLSIQDSIYKAVNGRSYSSELIMFSKLKRNQITFLHDSLRVIELVRHQTVYSLVRKLINPMGPIKRMIRDASKRVD